MGVDEVKVHSSSSINDRSLIFTYGTLKRGFPNHVLMQDLIRTNNAAYLGVYRTVKNYPLVCGPWRVPFLLNFPDSGERIWGELYAVSEHGLSLLDELEGTSRNHYERLPIEVSCDDNHVGSDGVIEKKVIRAEAYYGHRSYASEMWKKNGEKGFLVYSDEEAKGYVKRADRPGNLSFVDHIRLFLST
ncbi:hypothetical protein ACHQM5_022115 [Ranunculus cassubicifolius]